MDITVKELSRTERELTVTLPAATVEERVESKLKTLGRKAHLKGFRKGKVPVGMLRKIYGDQARGEAINELLNESYPMALMEQKLTPIDQAVIDKVDHEPGGELCFVARVEVEPEVELTKYKGVPVVRRVRDVQDRDMERALESLQRQYATWIPLEAEAGALSGDQLVCNIQETDESGKALEGRLYRNIEVELGKGQYGPAFDEQMVGIKPGENRAISVTNDADDPDPELAGKTEHYQVTVHEVKRAELAELNDDFAKEVPPGFDTLDELKVRVREDLVKQLDRAIEQNLHQSLIEALLEANPVDVPEKMIDNQLDDLIHRAKEGTDNPIDEDIVRRSYRDQVTRNIQWSLVARAILKQEEIRVEESDMDAEIQRYAGMMGVDAQTARLQLRRGGGLDRLAGELLDKKLMGFLSEQAEISEEPWEVENGAAETSN